MMSIEEFDEIKEEHEFSDTYKKRKQRIICEYKRRKNGKYKSVRAAATVAAICMISVGTVYAAPKIYEKYFSDNGKVSTVVNLQDLVNDEKLEMNVCDINNDSDIAEIEINLKYLPEGLKNNGKDEYTYCNDDSIMYIVPAVYDSEEEWNSSYVIDKRVLDISDHKAFLVKHQYTSELEKNYIDIAVLYPEYGRIVLYRSSGSISEEELIKIADNAVVCDTGRKLLGTNIDVSERWSTYLKEFNDRFELDKDSSYEIGIDCTVVENDMMKNIYQVNEEFTKKYTDIISGQSTYKLHAKVTDVQILDDVSVLEYVPDKWEEFVNDDMTVGSVNLVYEKFGDGVDTLNTIVKKESKKLKLVYVTAEYKNTGNTSLREVIYFASMLNLKQHGNKWYINDEAFRKSMGENHEYDRAEFESTAVGFGEMVYHYPYTEDMGTNVIHELKAGETFEMNFAWLIPEDELDSMYLSFGRNVFEFDESDLEEGYVKLK